MIHKDLLLELRVRQVWPAMLLLGTAVALAISIQMDLSSLDRQRLGGGLLWVAILFSSALALDRMFSTEREQGCLQGLLLYPVAGSTVYLAKLIVSFMCLGCLECVLIPLFVLLADVPLLAHPWALALVALLGNSGFAAVSTLLSATTSTGQNRSHLIALMVLPLAMPVVLGTAEATRLMMAGDFDREWARWIQLLAAFSVVFITAGMMLFEFIVEE
jgi:heme exporter protein B